MRSAVTLALAVVCSGLSACHESQFVDPKVEAAKKVAVAKQIADAQHIKFVEQKAVHDFVDPNSAQFRDVFISPSDHVCGEVNAKNRLGGYVGFKGFVELVHVMGKPSFVAVQDDDFTEADALKCIALSKEMARTRRDSPQWGKLNCGKLNIIYWLGKEGNCKGNAPIDR